MSRRSKLTDEEYIAAVQEYQDGKGDYGTIAKNTMYQNAPSAL